MKFEFFQSFLRVCFGFFACFPGRNHIRITVSEIDRRIELLAPARFDKNKPDPRRLRNLVFARDSRQNSASFYG